MRMMHTMPHGKTREVNYSKQAWPCESADLLRADWMFQPQKWIWHTWIVAFNFSDYSRWISIFFRPIITLEYVKDIKLLFSIWLWFLCTIAGNLNLTPENWIFANNWNKLTCYILVLFSPFYLRTCLRFCIWIRNKIHWICFEGPIWVSSNCVSIFRMKNRSRLASNACCFATITTTILVVDCTI